MIFSEAQDFHLTSDVGNALERLNYRYERCFAPFRAELAGARVLELGSHTGRFTWAALRHLGAAHVTGLEKEPAYVASARRSLAACGIEAERYRFLCGDAATLVESLPQAFDAVLNAGFLYYVQDPARLLEALKELGPRFMLFDGALASVESVRAAGGGYRDREHLEALLRAAGWDLERVDHRGGYGGYGRGTRGTYGCRAR